MFEGKNEATECWQSLIWLFCKLWGSNFWRLEYSFSDQFIYITSTDDCCRPKSRDAYIKFDSSSRCVISFNSWKSIKRNVSFLLVRTIQIFSTRMTSLLFLFYLTVFFKSKVRILHFIVSCRRCGKKDSNIFGW